MKIYRPKYRIFWIIFLTTIFVQLIFFVAYATWGKPPIIVNNDGGEYYNLAQNLLTNGKFIINPSSNIPESFRTPGYPLFLAGLLSIINEPWIIVFAQILLSAMIAWLIFNIAKIFVNNKYALLASALFIFNPQAWYWSVQSVTEVLFATLLTLALFLFIKFFKFQKVSYLIGGEAILTITLIIKPISLYIVYLMIIILPIYCWFKFKEKKKAWLALGMFLLFYAIMILPWQYRNYKIFNNWQISSVRDYNLYYFNARVLYAKKK